MKQKVSNIFFWVLVGLILIYLAISIIPSLFSTESVRVEPAQAITYDDALYVRGIALRDEVLVTASGTPASVDYKVSNGDRVSRGDKVAVYNDVDVSASDRLTIELIDRQINLLSDCISATSQFDLKTLDARTKNAISGYLNTVSDQNLSAAREASEDVLSCLIKHDIKATGDKEYYRQILKNCENEKAAVLSGSSSKQSTVSAPLAGYFTSRFDGYEALASKELTESGEPITPEKVKDLLSYVPASRGDNYIGKLQHFSYWKYVCTVPEEEAERFTLKSSWTLRFQTASAGTRDVTMTVAQVSQPSNGEVAIVFACTFFDEALYSLRISDAQVILRSYSGFRVRKDSVRLSEGKTGVYVLSGAKLIFKPVTVLYMSDDSDFAVVSPADKSAARALVASDSVVVGGKDIYDEKVVNIN